MATRDERRDERLDSHELRLIAAETRLRELRSELLRLERVVEELRSAAFEDARAERDSAIDILLHHQPKPVTSLRPAAVPRALAEWRNWLLLGAFWLALALLVAVAERCGLHVPMPYGPPGAPSAPQRAPDQASFE